MQKNIPLRSMSAAFLVSTLSCCFVAGRVCAGVSARSRPEVSAPNRIEIAAGDLRIVLEKVEHGLLVSGLTDTATGQELLAAEPLPLFAVTLRDATSKELLTITADSGWKQAYAAYSETRNRHTLVFRDPTDERLAGLLVTVTLDIAAPDNWLIWDLRITNDNPT